MGQSTVLVIGKAISKVLGESEVILIFDCGGGIPNPTLFKDQLYYIYLPGFALEKWKISFYRKLQRLICWNILQRWKFSEPLLTASCFLSWALNLFLKMREISFFLFLSSLEFLLDYVLSRIFITYYSLVSYFLSSVVKFYIIWFAFRPSSIFFSLNRGP